MNGQRVIVIGGGVIGLCCAYYALRRGMEVTIVEREQLDSEGCSFGNAGMIVPSHFVPLAAPGMVRLGLKWMRDPESPFYIRPRLSWELFSWGLRFWRSSSAARASAAEPVLRDLNLRSRQLYSDLAEGGMSMGLEKRGLLMLCKLPQTLDEESHFAAKANQLGIPAKVLDSAAVREIDSNITYDIAGAVYFPLDCHLDPQRFIAAMKSALTRAGCRIVCSAHVHGWSKDRDRRISGIVTNVGTIEGDQFVLAAGVWSSVMARDLGLKVPMQSGKGYSLTLEAPVELPKVCSILTEARIAVTPMGSRLRFGGTMEIGGIHGRIQSNRIAGIVKNIPKYFPRFEREQFEGVEPWFGHRPCSPDGLPYIGHAQCWKNLWIATGHAMMGLSLAPVTGDIIATLMDGGRPEFDLQLLSPCRYG